MPQVGFQEIFHSPVILDLQSFHLEALQTAQHFSSRSVVALSGPLGAGKTEFVRAVAKARGFQDMASPTFAIHHRYQGYSLNIDHLDLYRLESEDELETTGFWDFFSEPEGLIFIEWPERMDLSHISLDWDLYLLEIQVNPQGQRTLKLSQRI